MLDWLKALLADSSMLPARAWISCKVMVAALAAIAVSLISLSAVVS